MLTPVSVIGFAAFLKRIELSPAATSLPPYFQSLILEGGYGRLTEILEAL